MTDQNKPLNARRTTVRKSRPRHEKSENLDDEENMRLIEVIRKMDSVTLSTAIVQLYLTQKPQHTNWIKTQTGILCFTKDYARKSYFFQLFELNGDLLWEQEVYNPLKYNKLTNNFHYFAADESNAGFNFAFQDEANAFYNAVLNKTMKTAPKAPDSNLQINFTYIKRKEENTPSSQPVVLKSNDSQKSNEKPIKKEGFFNTLRGKLDKKRPALSKLDISVPTGFQVVQHIGLDKDKGFEVNLTTQDEASEVMRKLLNELNLPMNKKTEKFIQSFYEQHGGAEKVIEAVKQDNERMPNKDYEQSIYDNLDDEPVISRPSFKTPPTVHKPHVPPPPPPPLAPVMDPNLIYSVPPPKNKSTSGPPPPPPPPLPENGFELPQPHTPNPIKIPSNSTQKSMIGNNSNSGTSALLASIQQFKGFNENRPAQQTKQRESEPKPVDPANLSIADQLRIALRDREKFLRDDDDDDDDEANSDWEED